TGFNRTVTTAPDGSYRFPSLPVGTYNVLAELAGFGSVTTRNVELNVASENNVNVTLKQAAVKEQITVTAQAPLIETTPSVGTVEEFKIQTMQYKAEFGRSSGGVLTVVTKSGTNDFRGSVLGFFRDKSLNEKTESERLAGVPKSDYKRKQYGASLGGPIVRDLAHFFATYEKLNRDTNYPVTTGGIYPNLDGQIVPTPFRDELITAKGSVNLSAAQFLQVRYGYQKNTDIYGASNLGPPSSLGTTANKYSSVLGGHTWTIGGSKLNEFVYQWTKFDNSITANSSEPNLNFPSGFFVGQNPNTPQTTHQKKNQFKDDFSWSSTLGGKRHDLKAGVNY